MVLPAAKVTAGGDGRRDGVRQSRKRRRDCIGKEVSDDALQGRHPMAWKQETPSGKWESVVWVSVGLGVGV